MAIVGAGFAGIAAALWAKRLGLSFIILEGSNKIGGQLHWIHNLIPDFPAFWGTGRELLKKLSEQLREFDIAPVLNAPISAIDPAKNSLYSNERVWRAETIVAATGLSRRKLGIPGESTLRGISYTYSGCPELFEGSSVAVIGGGDGAFENALMMSEKCPEVHLFFRGEKPRASAKFVARAVEKENVHLHPQCTPIQFEGDSELRGIRFRGPEGEFTFPTERALIKIGFVPNSRWLRPHCQLLPSQFVWTDRNMRTSCPNIWAIGDLAEPNNPSLSVAAGHACIALRNIAKTIA